MPSLVKDLADALSLSADEANGRKSQVRPSRDDLREFAEAVLGEPDDKSPVGSKQDLATVRGVLERYGRRLAEWRSPEEGEGTQAGPTANSARSK